MPAERIISGSPALEDTSLENRLRPRTLAEFVGQSTIKDNLAIAIQAARARGEPLDHILLYGPPGLGKTTLANIISAEMGVSIRVTSGPAIERQGDLAAILTSLQPQDILFVDEIHRLNRSVEEILYPAMEDRALDIIIGKGAGARSLRLQLPPFSLLGATTRFALLSPPLRDRFGAVYRLDYYDDAAMLNILQRSAKILDVTVSEDAFREIACRTRGTPRVANRILKRVRDYAQVRADGVVSHEVALEALANLNIDSIGLDDVDHKVLLTITQKFGGGPVGLETIAAAVGEEPDTIMDVYEPYLIQIGFLERTPRGRRVTEAAYRHLGLPMPSRGDLQPGLWGPP